MSLSQTTIETPAAGDGAPLGRRLSAGLAGLRVRLPGFLLGLSFPAVLLALWWVSADQGWLPPQILPAPPLVWSSLAELWASGQLAEHVGVSLWRVAVGFAGGAGFGLLLGAAAGLFPTFRAYVYPPVQAVSRVNVLAWMPLLALFLGIDEALKCVVIAWSAAIPVFIGTERGIAGTPSALSELGDAFAFRAGDRLRLIVLPAALPSIFTGLREGLANAWQTLVLAELFASFEGLGYLMTWGRQLFQLDLVLIAMIVVSLLGLSLDTALGWVERRAQPWGRETGAAGVVSSVPSRRPGGWLGGWDGRAVLAFAAVLVLWIAARRFGWVDLRFLPSPLAIVERFHAEITGGTILADVAATLHRNILGFAIGAAVGLVLGSALGVSRLFAAVVGPTVVAQRQTALFAWVPLLAMWFGGNDVGKIAFISVAAFQPIVINTWYGIAQVPAGYRELSAVLLFRRHDYIRLVALPAALPSIFTGLHAGLIYAWLATVGSELFLNISSGLGGRLSEGSQLFQIDLLFLVILIFAAIGLVYNALAERAEALLVRWKTR
ncbi:sulfonate transport system permease protein [Azospirillum agricola]|uniref:ABC transporter permease n=1 Tax=Azospirillum agricola TaxID=1720247 RepID=UPI001AE77E7D|nr:ABC transporter permease [Azospirillum agricola]MBP2231899.1 sulfonate transport system permease protein [Azospirillum agricola]